MRKFKLLALVTLFTGAAFTAAAAPQETITFYGQVTDATCDITLDGGVDSNTVWLPSIPKTAISAVGAVTEGATDFTFELTGCPASSTVSVRMKGNSPSTSGNLSNVETATNKAEQVEIQIVDKTSSQPVDFNQGLVIVGNVTSSATGEASIPFTAQYYAAGTTDVVGLVQASLDYEIVYP